MCLKYSIECHKDAQHAPRLETMFCTTSANKEQTNSVSYASKVKEESCKFGIVSNIVADNAATA